MKKFAFSLLLLLASPALLWAEDSALQQAQELALAVQKRAVSTNAMQADFVRQSKYVAVGNDGASQVLGSGRLYWAEPLRLRLEQDSPSQELIVADGKSVWWVRPDRQRADVYPIDSFTSSLRSLLDVLGGLAGLSKDFNVQISADADLSDQPGELTLVLTPRQPKAELNRLVLWLNKDSFALQGFRFSNLVGDTTQYRFSQLQLNKHMPASTFSYQAPEGFRVNDQR